MRASLLNPPTGGNGYYLCDGSVKNTTTDSALFAVIGYTYGGISPSPNFNLPNLLARFPVGPTTSSSMTYLNNSTGGVTTGNVTLNETNLPPHIHTSNSTTTTTISNSRQFIISNTVGDFNNGNGGAKAPLGFIDVIDAITVSTTVTHTIGNGPGTSTPFLITPPYSVIPYYIKR